MSTTNAKTFFGQIERIAELLPEANAIVDAHETLSFRKLLGRAYALARQLPDVPREVVGLLFPPSADYVTGLLGTAMAGGAFMPLDPSFPVKRLERFLSVARCRTVVTTEALAERYRDWEALGVRFVILTHEKASAPDVRFEAKPLDPAYVMFTSGSTGEPKAVLGNHRGLAHFLAWERREFDLEAHPPRSSWLSAITFDVSLRDILIPLTTGGTLFVPTEDERTVPHRLATWLRQNRITFVHCVPTVLRLLTQALEAPLPDIRTVLSAGEPLYVRDVERFRELAAARPGQIEMVNLYGPTETTLAKFFFRIPPEADLGNDPGRMLPIGKPLPDTAGLILDGDELCEVGEIGEIYIRTRYRTNGYLNRPDLTRRAFVANPLTQADDDLIYRTGDLGRYIDDQGSVECLGRRDGQVKINGVRIETGEVETDMRAIPGVRDAAVVAVADATGQKHLVGYATLAEDTANPLGGRAEAPERIRRALAEVLAPASVPSLILIVEDMPRTTSGKVNKRLLPKPEALESDAASEIVAPEGDTEVRLVALWKKLLGRDVVGVTTSFAQLGGDSLRAIKALSMIYREFGANLSLKEFFAAPTIRSLAPLVEANLKSNTETEGAPARNADRSSAGARAPRADYPLTEAQMGMWAAEMMGSGTVYTLPETYRIEGEIDLAALNTAFADVVARHDALRTVFFVDEKGRVRQRFAESLSVALEDLGLLTPEAFEAARAENAAHAFDLEKGPLLRLAVARVPSPTDAQAEPSTYLLFNIHHLIADVASMNVFAEELSAAYLRALQGGERSEPDQVPAASYGEHLERRAALGTSLAFVERARQRAAHLQGLPRTSVPLANVRPDAPSFRGATLSKTLPGKVFAFLKNASQKGATPYAAFLAVVDAFLAEKAGELRRTVVTGVPLLGRAPGEESTIGCFIDVAPVCVEVDRSAGVDAQLRAADTAVKAALENADVPMTTLSRLAREDVPQGRSPFFDVLVAAVSDDLAQPHLGERRMTPLENHNAQGTARYDAVFHLTMMPTEAIFDFHYALDILDVEAAEALVEAFLVTAMRFAQGDTDPDPHARGTGDRDSEALRTPQSREETSSDTSRPFEGCSSPARALRHYADIAGEAPAVLSPDASGEIVVHTYAELHARMTVWAGALLARGIRPGHRIAYLAPRTAESLLLAAAIDALGAVAVPLDPDYPAGRLETLLRLSRPELLILPNRTTVSWSIPEETTVLEVDALERGTPYCDIPDVSADAPSVILFTSGTTGTPKGSIATIGGLANTAEAFVDALGITPKSRVLHFAGSGFDASVLNLRMTWAAGAAAVLLTREIIERPKSFEAWLKKACVSTAIMPPAYLRVLETEAPEALLHAEAVLSAGEVPPRGVLLRLLKAGVKVFNGYGPSETAVCATMHAVGEEDLAPGRAVPIGRALPNVRLRVVSPSGETVSAGEEGELWVGGIGLARGYLNPDETARAFVQTPEGRFYRTGDLVRETSSGELVFLGRADRQVKISGNRIEPDEVAEVLTSCPSLKDAAVVPMREGDEWVLVGIWVAQPGFEALVTEEMLVEWMAARLPSYAVVTRLCAVDAVPTTPNGKVDASAIARLITANEAETAKTHAGASGSSANAPDELASWPENDRILGRVFRDILRKPLGRTDNFLRAGIDSVRAIRAVQRLADLSLTITVRDVFEAQTIEKLARRLETPSASKFVSPAEQRSTQGALQTPDVLCPTALLERFVRLGADFRHTTQSVELTLRDTDDEALARALATLARRHAALRVRFALSCGHESSSPTLTGRVRPADHAHDWPLVRVENPNERADAAYARLDPAQGHLCAAAIAGNQVLLLVHHLAVDAFSWRILLDELHTLLAGGTLDEREEWSVAHWSARLLEPSARRIFEAETPLWIDRLLAYTPVRTTTRPEGCLEVAQRRADAAFVRRLDAAAARWNLRDPEALLLSALTLALRRTCSCDRLTPLIWAERHGRSAVSEGSPLAQGLDLAQAVGWFTAMEPLAPKGECASDLIAHTAAQLAQSQLKGLGFGVLALDPNGALAPGLALSGHAEFNWLGRMDEWRDAENGTQAATRSPFTVTGLGVVRDAGDFPAASPVRLTALVNERGEFEATFGADPSFAKADALSCAFEEALELVLSAPVSTTLNPTEENTRATLENEVETALDAAQVSLDALPEAAREALRARYGRLEERVEAVRPLSWQEESYFYDRRLAPKRPPGWYIRNFTYRIEGELDPEALRHAFGACDRVFENLRTAYVERLPGVDGHVAVRLKRRAVPCVFEDLSERKEEEALSSVAQHAERMFLALEDISRDPLFSVGVFKIAPRDWRVVTVFHHIALDRWSANQLFAATAGGELPEVLPSYDAYARTQRARDTRADQLWWKAQLACGDCDGTLPGRIPFDYVPGSTHPSAIRTYRLSPEEADRIREAARFWGTSPAVLYAWSAGLVLSRIKQARAPYWKVQISGRAAPLADIDKTPGCFMNPVPQVFAFDPEASVRTSLEGFRAHLLDCEMRVEMNLDKIPPMHPVSKALPDLAVNVQSQESFVTDATPEWFTNNVRAESGTNEGIVLYNLIFEDDPDASGAVRYWFNYSPLRVETAALDAFAAKLGAVLGALGDMPQRIADIPDDANR